MQSGIPSLRCLPRRCSQCEREFHHLGSAN
jgi:hypothetical protein